MAGDVEGFDPDEFRGAITATMRMGMAQELDDQPLFVFPRTITNAAPADNEKVPFDPTARPDRSPARTERVPCVVDYVDAAGRVEAFGIINPSKIKVSLLDVHYQTIEGFEHIMISGDKYNYMKTEPPIALGSVTVWTVHCRAEDES